MNEWVPLSSYLRETPHPFHNVSTWLDGTIFGAESMPSPNTESAGSLLLNFPTSQKYISVAYKLLTLWDSAIADQMD